MLIAQQGQPVARLVRSERTTWPCKAGSAKDKILWIAPDFDAPLDEIKETHRCLTIRFAEARARPRLLAGVLAWDGAGCEWTAVCNGRVGELRTAMTDCGARIVAERVPSLDEIFVVCRAPSAPRKTISVKVPPISAPTRHPGIASCALSSVVSR